MVITLWANLCVSLQIWLVEDGVAFNALFPEAFGYVGAIGTLIFIDT